MHRQSNSLVESAEAVWSNLLLRQLLLAVPVGLDLAFQAGAGTLDGLGPWYPLGVCLVALAVAVGSVDVLSDGRWRWPAYLLPVMDFGAIGLVRLVPEPNGLGLLIVFPAMWLGLDLRARGVGLTALYTTLLVCVPVLLYADPSVVLVGRYVQVLVLAVLVSVSMAITARAWRRRDADAATQREVISDLLAAERAHRALTEAVTEAVDVGLLSLDPDGTYRSMNPRHEEFMDLAYPDGHDGQAGQLGWVFAADGHSFLPREDMPTIRAREQDLHDYLIWVGEDPDERRALAISSRATVDVDGRATGHVLVYKDVTDLVGALRVKDEFVASVSHELRTPLTSIMGYIDLTLLDQGLAPRSRRQLDVARKNTSRLLHLVNDLLLTAQTDQGHLRLDSALVDLAAVVGNAVDQVSEHARACGVALEVDVPEVAWVMGDDVRLAQVVDNLLTNAVKYSLDGGRVEVHLALDRDDQRRDPAAVLTVADQGIGIPEEDRPRVFSRFFRTQEAQERAIPGAGLGLSITRSLVEAHGGEIEVDANPGGGTVFHVRLPLAVVPSTDVDV